MRHAVTQTVGVTPTMQLEWQSEQRDRREANSATEGKRTARQKGSEQRDRREANSATQRTSEIKITPGTTQGTLVLGSSKTLAASVL